jgi:hypothetical protein
MKNAECSGLVTCQYPIVPFAALEACEYRIKSATKVGYYGYILTVSLSKPPLLFLSPKMQSKKQDINDSKISPQYQELIKLHCFKNKSIDQYQRCRCHWLGLTA